MKDKEYTLKSSIISDLDGKYGYPIDEDGVYKVSVTASGYKPYEKFLNLSRGNELIEEVALTKVNDISSVANDLDKIKKYQMLEAVKIINVLVFLLITLGFLFNLYNVASSPTLFNLIVFVIYSLIMMVNIYLFIKKNKSTSKARIIDQNKNPVSSAVVKVYSDNKQVGVYVTNGSGEFKAKLPSGEYKIMISKTGIVLGDRMYKVFVNRDGYIVDDVVIETKFPNFDKDNLVVNPFS